jgi:integrase/recombinase XerD
VTAFVQQPPPHTTLTDGQGLTRARLEEYAQASRLIAELEAMKDDAYQHTTGLGPAIREYLDYKRIERGLAVESIANRESPLRRLALDFAHMTVADFGNREGSRLLRRFITKNWGDRATATVSNRTSLLRDFFGWAYREAKIEFDPMRVIESPRTRGKRRRIHDRDRIAQIVLAQGRECDRLAIECLGRLGFRKNDLRMCQLGHFDFRDNLVYVFGKGDKEANIPIFPDLARRIQVYALEREFLNPSHWREEYLIYWHQLGRRGSWDLGYTTQTTVEDRMRQLSSSGVHSWWRRCLVRAKLEHFPMHELRHSAATAFHLGPARGDYELTRQFLRHENIQTTAGYVQMPTTHLREAVRRTPNFWGEDEKTPA